MAAISSPHQITSFISLDEVPRYQQGPLPKMPLYVYGNINQATCKQLSPQGLTVLLNMSQNPAIEKILFPDPEHPSPTAVLRAEEIDWVRGIRLLETEYLTPGQDLQLTPEKIMEINEIFARLNNPDAGKMREVTLYWPREGFTREDNFTQLIFQTLVQNSWIDKLGKERGVSHPKQDLALVADAAEQRDAFLARLNDPESRETVLYCTSEEYRKKVMEMRNSPIVYCFADDQGQFSQDDVDFSKLIPSFQTIQDPQDSSKTILAIEIYSWLREKVHYFPTAAQIYPELAKACAKMNDTSKHPIQRAARVWYEIVRIHISHEANKRTGKAIGSALLAQCGYLPPIIGCAKEDADEYFKIFMECMAEPKGHKGFTDYVARKMITSYPLAKSEMEREASLISQ